MGKLIISYTSLAPPPSLSLSLSFYPFCYVHEHTSRAFPPTRPSRAASGVTSVYLPFARPFITLCTREGSCPAHIYRGKYQRAAGGKKSRAEVFSGGFNRMRVGGPTWRRCEVRRCENGECFTLEGKNSRGRQVRRCRPAGSESLRKFPRHIYIYI